jgi:endonuclease/exonuclease/phosphatase (EEP) superfamily protein YafD
VVVGTSIALGMTLAVLGGCETAVNYDDPSGPRYAGDHAGAPVAARDYLLVVTYNLEYATEVDKAIAALSMPPLADADAILMQEMDADATDRISDALGLRYVYYPASVHKYGRDFGPAILTPHPIIADHKVILPHHDPPDGRLRTATAATIDVTSALIELYSVHTSIITLGLGARLDQVETVIDNASGFAGPAVVGGDFNTGDPDAVDQTVDTFTDREWAWASAGTDDTAESNGAGFLLDFIFARGFGASAAGVFDGDSGSDHRPVWVRIERR